MKLIPHLFLLCSLAVSAALAQDGPEITSQQAPATFSSGVNLVSVPVVVRDSNGHAIGELRREDFRLFDKGKQQVITKFSVEVNAVRSDNVAGVQATPAAALPTPLTTPTTTPLLPNRYVAYVFDDVHLSFQDLARVRTAAERHFAEALTPAMRAAIYTTSGRLAIDFTEDRQQLHDALLRIGPNPSAAVPPGTDCPDIIGAYQAGLILNQSDTLALADAAVELGKCLPKAAITTGTVVAYSQMSLSANNLNVQASINVLASVIQRISVMPGSRNIVLISPGFVLLAELRAKEMELMDRAIRSHITISSLDARGADTPLLADAGQDSALGFGRRDPDSLAKHYMLEEARVGKFVLDELADGTGGSSFKNDNGLLEGLRQLASPPQYTYVLRFSPQNLKLDGSYHQLKIILTNSKGLAVQARRGYWAPNRAADAAEQAREEIQEAVFSLDEVRDFPVEVTTDFFKLNDASAELTVASHLDMNAIKFRTAGDRSQDTLTVVTALFDQDGHYVRGIRRAMDLRLREQTLQKVLGSGMDVQETFDVAPGRYVVRVVVRDAAGTMAARNGTVNIP